MKNVFTFEHYQSYIKGTELDTTEHVEYLKSRKLTYIPEKEYTQVGEQKYEQGVSIPIDKIAGFYTTNQEKKNGISLYELLTSVNPFRFTSLEKFFKITQETSVQQSKEWLNSTECAQSDSSKIGNIQGEMPTAKYFRDIDKYFIESGKNRAFAGMLIGAKEYRVAAVIEWDRVKDAIPLQQDTEAPSTPSQKQEPNNWFQKLIRKFFTLE
ncbi:MULTISPECIES: hypothetical protein [Bacillus cereus group]|uniref:hypothetical protein n=1 Tax=Bacillus cereus group TaxID=86661 RepID=UPI000BFBA43D|nr:MULTISPECIES: hypothetical protein [Bacillus cereus group]PHG45979.1 hypothetical protein COI54_16695 [Bacillus wiedmannii]